MRQKKYLLSVPLTIIFILVIISYFPGIRFEFSQQMYDKYPVKTAVFHSAHFLFCVAYCIFYVMFLLLLFNKALLKLHNRIIFPVLILSTVVFIVVMVSDFPSFYLGNEDYNHHIFGNFFWESQWYEWAGIRLAYSIFYAVFILLVLNAKLFKLPEKIIFSVISLAGIANFIWIFEVSFRGWRGLYWLEYIHIAIFIIGILFLYWLVIINKMNKNEKYIKDVLFYGILFILFLFIFAMLLKLTFGHIKVNNSWGWIFREMSENLTHYILNVILQIVIIFLINILVIKYEKIIITPKIICINLFSMILIPVYTFLSSFIILNEYIKEALEILTFSYISAIYFDPIDWIKLGNIIFGFVIYECIFIAYIKQNKLSGIETSHNVNVNAPDSGSDCEKPQSDAD